MSRYVKSDKVANEWSKGEGGLVDLIWNNSNPFGLGELLFAITSTGQNQIGLQLCYGQSLYLGVHKDIHNNSSSNSSRSRPSRAVSKRVLYLDLVTGALPRRQHGRSDVGDVVATGEQLN